MIDKLELSDARSRRKDAIDSWRCEGTRARENREDWNWRPTHKALCGSPADRATPVIAAIDNALKAAIAASSLTEANPGKLGGKLLIVETRFPVSQLIAELADDGQSIASVCANYDLDVEKVTAILHAIASAFSKPAV